MADESVRSLLATLGFELDTTGADQFEARFKKLESTIGTLARKIDKFQPKFDKKKGKKAAFSFGRALKKGLSKGFESVEFKPGAKIGASLRAGLTKAFNIAKVAALAGAAALAAVVTKGVLKFSSIQQAELALEFRAKEDPLDFEEIKKRLEASRLKTGEVVAPLEALNILGAGLETTGKFERALQLVESAIKLGKVRNEDATAIITQLGTFVKTGGNLDALEQLNLFDRDAIEALGLAGTGFGKAAQRTRFEKLLELLEGDSKTLDQFFGKFLSLSAAKADKLGVVVDKVVADIGERFIISADKALKFIGVDLGDPEKAIKKLVTRPKGQGEGTLNLPPGTRGGPPGSGSDVIDVTIQGGVQVEINGVPDPVAVGNIFDEKFNKKIKDTSDNIKRGDVSTGFPADEVPQ